MLTPVIETEQWYIGKLEDKPVIFRGDNIPPGVIKESIMPLRKVKNAITNVRVKLNKSRKSTSESILDGVTEHVQPYFKAIPRKGKITYDSDSFTTEIWLDGPSIVVDDYDNTEFDISDPDVFKKVGKHILGLYLKNMSRELCEMATSEPTGHSNELELLVCRLTMSLLENPDCITVTNNSYYVSDVVENLRRFKEVYNKVWDNNAFGVNAQGAIIITNHEIKFISYALSGKSRMQSTVCLCPGATSILPWGYVENEDFNNVLKKISDFVPDKKKINALKCDEESVRELIKITKSIKSLDVFVVGDEWK
jgi:hypothetical protein